MLPLISQVDLFQLASGDRLSLQVYKFIGKPYPKKAYIQSNLHGSEIVGNGVIYQLIEFFSSLDRDQIEGEIWLVPVCNPLGTNQRSHFFATGRFNHYDGKDWNRIFWDYEKECNHLKEFAQEQVDLNINQIRNNYLTQIQQAFAKQLEKIKSPSSARLSEQYRYHLQSLCLDANYVIDIHSSSNRGIDYLYCFHGRQESAKYFLLDYGILMTEYDGDAFDEAFMKPWLALEKQLLNLGNPVNFEIESWTLELGTGMVMIPESVSKGVAGIINYLQQKKMLHLAQEMVVHEMEFITREQIQNYYAPSGGTIQSRLPLKSRVKLGERLYQILSFNKKGELPIAIDISAETDGLVFDISTNESVNQGEYVLAILKDNP